MNLLTALARFLVFPGLLFAVPAAWLVLWLERKTVALLQQRIGPPFGQPFFDFVKLMGKSTPPRPGINGLLMRAWPLIAVSASAGAVGLLPVLPVPGRISRRLDSAARPDGDSCNLHDCRRLLLALSVRRNRFCTRGRSPGLLQSRIPSGGGFHRRLAALISA